MSAPQTTGPLSPETPASGPTRTENWARPVDRLSVLGVPAGAINLNVQGRQLAGPLRGFGQMWQKTYRIRLVGAQVSPAQLVSVWRERFPSFWPELGRFYGADHPIEPGDVAVLNLAGPAGTQVATGVMVIYADEESFCFMTPQGHMFGGMITFSGEDDSGTTVAVIDALIRASDPMIELAFRLGIGHKQEDDFWKGTLLNLAKHFGVQGQDPTQRVRLVDPKVRWSEAGNIWHSAAIRTALHGPVRWLRRMAARR